MERKGSQKERDEGARDYKKRKTDADLAMLKEMFSACAPEVKFIDCTNKLGGEDER